MYKDASDRHYLAGIHAQGYLPSVIVGGHNLSMVLDANQQRFLRTLSELPLEFSNSERRDKQPLVLRIQRNPGDTLLVCVNESPWPLEAQLDLEATAVTKWQAVNGIPQTTEGPNPLNMGEIPSGPSNWPVEMGPFELRAWKFADPQLRLGEIRIRDDQEIHAYLATKIQDIETRAGNLNLEREYHQLQNPGFEVEEGTARIFGWQTRKGTVGNITIESSPVRSGARALRLQSADQLGVAVQSHLFPIPETGVLIAGASFWANHIDPQAQLYLIVESDDDGKTYQQVRRISSEELLTQQWVRLELPTDGLPVGVRQQLRIRLQVVGNADLLVDDVSLCDLRFNDQRRAELVKRIYAAKTALDADEIVDCLRLVNEYWSRYLVEYVPPLDRAPIALAKQPNASTSEQPDKRKKMGGRLRGFVPRIWR